MKRERLPREIFNRSPKVQARLHIGRGHEAREIRFWIVKTPQGFTFYSRKESDYDFIMGLDSEDHLDLLSSVIVLDTQVDNVLKVERKPPHLITH